MQLIVIIQMCFILISQNKYKILESWENEKKKCQSEKKYKNLFINILFKNR